MRFALYMRNENETQTIRDFIVKKLIKNNFIEDKNNPEVVICLGGDGNFLRAVHNYIINNPEIIFVGVNIGSLGFFCDYHVEDIDELIDGLQKRICKVEKYSLIDAELVYEKDTKVITAINEIRIENPFHTMICEVYVDDEFLEKYRGNGLIVATSLGSSAFNKSLGGAIVDEKLTVLQLTEIASIQNNIYRSLASSFVLSKERTVTFKGELNRIVLGFDSFAMETNSQLKEIRVRISTIKLLIGRRSNHSYIKNLHRSFIVDEKEGK